MTEKYSPRIVFLEQQYYNHRNYLGPFNRYYLYIYNSNILKFARARSSRSHLRPRRNDMYRANYIRDLFRRVSVDYFRFIRRDILTRQVPWPKRRAIRTRTGAFREIPHTMAEKRRRLGSNFSSVSAKR